MNDYERGTGIGILLNGASSSGKTSITAALRQVLDAPFYQFALDRFLGWAPELFHVEDPWFYYTDIPYDNPPPKQLSEDDYQRLIRLFPQCIGAFHAMIASALEAGCNVIIDHVFLRRDWLKNFVDVNGGKAIFLIGVTCNAAELERREHARGDRECGMAQYQANVVHRGLDYDCLIDTSNASALESALQIKEFMRNHAPTALRYLSASSDNRFIL